MTNNDVREATSFLDLHQAARLLGVDWRTVRARVLAGDLPAFRFGRKWRISEAALNEFMVGNSPAIQRRG